MAILPHLAAAAVFGLAAALSGAVPALPSPAPPAAIGHHHDDQPPRPHHQAHPAPGRFLTDRDAATLDLPAEDKAFVFAIFGDRTGGPPNGVAVLAEAVRDVNLLEPDLVMTVGDLVQGYNRRDEWLGQTREFKAIMDGLLCPWFPVAGNHDIYWRGGDPPGGEHESDYETHFGPLWYAFTHKGCWFIVLYSDEGDPATGVKSFEHPASQVMSDGQLAWLGRTLERARDADHVFVFLHHPRWLKGNYGDDWDRVHGLLAAAGNVSAVFAGHIHHMRSDGPRDGIEYVTLATTGGDQSAIVPQAGYLHQFTLVTVRRERIAIAAVPVGEVMDVLAITGRLAAETARLARVRPRYGRAVRVASDGSARGAVPGTLTNPTRRPIVVTMIASCPDSRWTLSPQQQHGRLEAGATGAFEVRVTRPSGGLDDAFHVPELAFEIEYLAAGVRYTIPRITTELPLDLDLSAPAVPRTERVLALDGDHDCLALASDALEVPDGPLTLECWFRARAFGVRTGLVTKTENSEFGIFVSRGRPSFSIFLGDRYVTAEAESPILHTNRWHHVAGVFDGRETRLYVDGRLVASAAGTGPRRTNDLPFIVGADVSRTGTPTSHFAGDIDAVRVSTVARYTGPLVEPPRRPRPDGRTVLLLNMDGRVGPWVFDESPSAAHPRTIGAPKIR